MKQLLAAAALAAIGVALASAEDVTFTFTPPADMTVSSVSLRGAFNGWSETPFALDDDGTWRVSVDLAPGDRLYMYSDGAVDGVGEEDSGAGEQRLLELLDAARYLPLDKGLDEVASRILGGGSSAEPLDDITILGLERLADD